MRLFSFFLLLWFLLSSFGSCLSKSLDERFPDKGDPISDLQGSQRTEIGLKRLIDAFDFSKWYQGDTKAESFSLEDFENITDKNHIIESPYFWIAALGEDQTHHEAMILSSDPPQDSTITEEEKLQLNPFMESIADFLKEFEDSDFISPELKKRVYENDRRKTLLQEDKKQEYLAHSLDRVYALNFLDYSLNKKLAACGVTNLGFMDQNISQIFAEVYDKQNKTQTVSAKPFFAGGIFTEDGNLNSEITVTQGIKELAQKAVQEFNTFKHLLDIAIPTTVDLNTARTDFNTAKEQSKSNNGQYDNLLQKLREKELVFVKVTFKHFFFEKIDSLINQLKTNLPEVDFSKQNTNTDTNFNTFKLKVGKPFLKINLELERIREELHQKEDVEDEEAAQEVTKQVE